jgi:hypothetical protein
MTGDAAEATAPVLPGKKHSPLAELGVVLLEGKA